MLSVIGSDMAPLAESGSRPALTAIVSIRIERVFMIGAWRVRRVQRRTRVTLTQTNVDGRGLEAKSTLLSACDAFGAATWKLL